MKSGALWRKMSHETYAGMSQEATTLYSGTFERSMDAKKRVAVPAPWLSKDEGEIFHVIPHPAERYLMVMPLEEFDRWEQRIQESQATAAEKRMAIRKFYSEAHTASDRQAGAHSFERQALRACGACWRSGVCRRPQPFRDLESGTLRGRGCRPFRRLQARGGRHRALILPPMHTLTNMNETF